MPVCAFYLFIYFITMNTFFDGHKRHRIWETVAVSDVYHFLPVQGGAGRSQLARAGFAASCEIPCHRAAVSVKGQMWLGVEAFSVWFQF